MLLDLLFPKICLSCGHWGTHICSRCRADFEHVLHDGCLYCDKRSLGGITCAGCSRRGGVDGLIAMTYYSETLSKIVKEIKYHLVRDAIPDLFFSLRPEIVAKTALYGKSGPVPRIQPVPLHKRRFRSRGFNQADDLAKHLARVTGFPCVYDLNRIRETQTQVKTSGRLERLRNLSGAFAIPCAERVADNVYILVDDVVTSGSTIKECAKTLKKAGAAEVYAWCLARD